MKNKCEIHIMRPNFQNFSIFFFYMGSHYVDFTFAFNTPLIRLEMTEIRPKYVAQALLPPPPESSAQDPPWIGLKGVLTNMGTSNGGKCLFLIFKVILL